MTTQAPIHRPIRAFSSALGAGVLLVLAGCGGSSNPAQATGPINVGELFSFTGPKAAVGASYSQGVQMGADEINSHGGVMGRQIQIYPADTAGDPVDAVAALRQLLTQHPPSYLIGPTSLEFNGVHTLIDSESLVSFAIIPSTAYDTLQDKWVYNVVASDSQQGRATAYYAIKSGLTRCALIFDNSQASQSLVTPLTNAFQGAGGTITANVSLVTGQPSYQSEVAQAFAGNPQCVFLQMDQTTAGTVFAAVRQQGHLNVPFLGTNVFSDPLYAKAIGAADDSKWVTTTQSAPASGAALSYLTPIFTAKFGAPPSGRSTETYDSMIVAALAMTAAHSTDPKVWVNKIIEVSNPGGQIVSNYADGVKLLNQGKKINYDGASSPMDFNQFHEITAGWEIEKFDPSGKQLQIVTAISPADLENFK